MANLPAIIIGGVALALLLASGNDKDPAPAPGAPGGEKQKCLRMIGEQVSAKLRNAPPHAILTFADMTENIGQHEAAACLRRMANEPEVDCTELIIEAVTKDFSMIGDPAVVRGFAAHARLNGMHELANCYDLLAAAM